MQVQELCASACAYFFNPRRASNLTAYCFCWRGTISQLCRRGEERISLSICSCSSLLWWWDEENKYKQGRGEKQREDSTGEDEECMRDNLFPLLKFIDRNTCATLSHNTAYDQYGPKPSPLSLCHVYIRTKHSSALSKLSLFSLSFPPASCSRSLNLLHFSWQQSDLV